MATVLVVENNPASLKMAALLVRNAGHIALQAENGKMAIRIVRDQLPDLVLMDIHMPDMDGLTTTRFLKQDDATAGIPIIALTSLAMRGDEENIYAAGYDGYIAKPFHQLDFLATIAQTLDRNAAECAEMANSAM